MEGGYETECDIYSKDKRRDTSLLTQYGDDQKFMDRADHRDCVALIAMIINIFTNGLAFIYCIISFSGLWNVRPLVMAIFQTVNMAVHLITICHLAFLEYHVRKNINFNNIKGGKKRATDFAKYMSYFVSSAFMCLLSMFLLWTFISRFGNISPSKISFYSNADIFSWFMFYLGAEVVFGPMRLGLFSGFVPALYSTATKFRDRE